MKKKVAVFANGWSNEYLELVLEGIRKCAAEENVDLFAFVNFSSADERSDNIGEEGVFTLPDIKSFDGVILIANTINRLSEREYLTDAVQKAGVPAISLEYELPGIPYLGTDNYKGFYNLAEHLIQEHQVKTVLFVSGPQDNEESQVRMQATRDALAAAGLELLEDNIVEAGWSYYTASTRVDEWLNRTQKLPDAVVCANDDMAMGVCNALESRGIDIPEQVIVTGCDYTKRGQELYPILTTVARHWEHLGYGGMKQLLRRIAGKQVMPRWVFDSEPVIGESCGCCVDEAKVAHRLKAIRELYRKQRETVINEWHLRHLDEELTKMRSVEGLKLFFKGDLEFNHRYEGENFLICLAEDYFADDEVRVINSDQYAENMETFIHLINGKAVPNKIFPARQLLPNYEPDESRSHIYLFVPLHIDEVCTGYVVQVDNLNCLYDQTLYTWVRHMSQDLERVRQNVHLEALTNRLRDVSLTDGLTGLRNRTGCDVLAIPYLQKCQKEGKTSAIVFADVNRMKMINDKFGHLQGDLALCTVAEAIKKTLPKDWIAVRYGGDEFIMAGACEDMAEADSIKQNLSDALEELKVRKKLGFPLTASFGTVVIQPGESYHMEEYLRKADEAMYEMKKQYHAREAK